MRNVIFSDFSRLCAAPEAYVYKCITGDSNVQILYLSHQLAKYTCLQRHFHNQITILQLGAPKVRMSLTHLRCRGWAKPR